MITFFISKTTALFWGIFSGILTFVTSFLISIAVGLCFGEIAAAAWLLICILLFIRSCRSATT